MRRAWKCFLEDVYIDFAFDNQELKISHPACPVYNLFSGITSYLIDFPEGFPLSNGIIQKHLNIGVWSEKLDDVAYILVREDFHKYNLECIEEEVRELTPGTILLQKETYVSPDTLRELAVSLKTSISAYLKSVRRTDVLNQLETNYRWLMKVPSSVDEYLTWRRDHRWW